ATSAIGMRTCFFERFAEISTILSAGGGKPACRRRATSEAACGRFAGSFARQAATVSSQAEGSNAGSILNSLRRSVIEGATRSWICRSMLPNKMAAYLSAVRRDWRPVNKCRQDDFRARHRVVADSYRPAFRFDL